MKRDNIDLSVTPPDLREAEALLARMADRKTTFFGFLG